jgi:phosphonate transport system ATP-binding protein
MAFLEIKDLKKIYPTGEEALKGITFNINANEFISVIGPSGGGKSTLLRCINRLIEPTSGSIVFEGIEMTHLNRKQLKLARRRIGMIFQEFNLIDRLPVIINVLCGRLGSTSLLRSLFRKFPKSDVEKAIELCERVGIKDHIYKRADELSGGQRQRVGVARALIQDPDILLVDEPTSSLDMRIQHEVMDLIYTLCKEENVPALVSIHDVKLAVEYSNRILGLQGGDVVFEDTSDKLDKETLNRIYKYND